MEEKNKEDIKKHIDESWKETVKKEKAAKPSGAAGSEEIESTFNLFISGLMIEALIALGEVENPITKTKEPNLAHAKFIIDTLGILQDKTKNNLTKDEEDGLSSILYELRMRFLDKSKGR